MHKRQINLLVDPDVADKIRAHAARNGMPMSAWVSQIVRLASPTEVLPQPPARPIKLLPARILGRLERFGGRCNLSVLTAPWRGRFTGEEIAQAIQYLLDTGMVLRTVVRTGIKGRPVTVIHHDDVPAVPPAAPMGSTAEEVNP
jgi:hypothetical protein